MAGDIVRNRSVGRTWGLHGNSCDSQCLVYIPRRVVGRTWGLHELATIIFVLSRFLDASLQQPPSLTPRLAYLWVSCFLLGDVGEYIEDSRDVEVHRISVSQQRARRPWRLMHASQPSHGLVVPQAFAHRASSLGVPDCASGVRRPTDLRQVELGTQIQLRVIASDVF